jgi:hypothetical protein
MSSRAAMAQFLSGGLREGWAEGMEWWGTAAE